ncbi:MAG: hypothetical protein GY703_12895 [Gammaproteobacteria bacterium]|nr:hypothetical protein [Gammaproteobacteria bacterium]
MIRIQQSRDLRKTLDKSAIIPEKPDFAMSTGRSIELTAIPYAGVIGLLSGIPAREGQLLPVKAISCEELTSLLR